MFVLKHLFGRFRLSNNRRVANELRYVMHVTSYGSADDRGGLANRNNLTVGIQIIATAEIYEALSWKREWRNTK